MDPRIDLGIGSFGRVFVFRLKPGMKIMETFKQMAIENNVKAGIIIKGAGAITTAKIRNLIAYAKEFPVGEPERLFTNPPGPIELLSLQGNIATTPEGETIVHAHGVFCGLHPAGGAFGGHLCEAEVYSNMELSFVEVLDMRISRELCSESKAIELKPFNE